MELAFLPGVLCGGVFEVSLESLLRIVISRLLSLKLPMGAKCLDPLLAYGMNRCARFGGGVAFFNEK